LIGGDQHGSPFVSGADEFEQHAGLCLIFSDIGEVVQDEQVILVEFGDCRFELECAPSGLELLDEIGRAGVQDAPSVLHECQTQGCP
jgi:hypothetical protein